MKKNNFAKIMNESIDIEKNAYFAYNDYLNKKRYGNISKDAEIESLRRQLADKEAEYAARRAEDEEKAREASKNEREIDKEVGKYLDDFEELQDDYFNDINELDGEIDECEELEKIETDPSKKAKLKSRIKSLETRKRLVATRYNTRLRNLNSRLSRGAREELEDMGSLMKKFDSNVNLSEDIQLSYLEEKIIFGDILENIENITLLEAVDPLTGEREKNNSAKQVNVAEKNAGAAQRRAMEAEKMKGKGQVTQSFVNQAKMDATAAELNKTKIDRLVAFKEAENPMVTAKEKVIDNKQLAIEKKETSFDKNIEKQKEALEKQKQQLEAIKAKQEQVSSSQKEKTPVNSQEATQLSEEMDKTDDPKTKIDFNNFTATMFSGDHGKILKYLLRADSKDLKSIDIAVANIIQKDPSAAEVLKKLKYYISKASSGLSYEEALDLKVQKAAFKKIYEDAMKEYKNKYFGTYGTPKAK